MNDAAREHSRFAAIFAGGTLISRVLGLARDIALVLIPLPSREAFFIAFRFPNMLRDLIGEGATNAAFVPTFSESRELEDPQALKRLVAACFGAMLVVLGAVTLLGMLLLPPLLRNGVGLFQTISQAEGKSAADVALMAELTFWIFPYLLFIGLAVFAMAPLFTVGRYAAPSWSPALLNVALIGACLLLKDAFPEPAYALVTGVWLGGIAQMLVVYVAMGRATGVWLPSFELTHPGVKAAFVLLVPVLLGQAAGELNKLVDTLFAAGLGDGAVNALFYSNRLVQLPLSIFGVATSVAILPALSRAGSRGDTDGLKAMFADGLLQCTYLVLPAMIGLLVMAEPIVRLLFEYGTNTADTTTMTGIAVVYYGSGLLSFALVKVAVAGFYAQKQTRTPVIIASASMLLNIALNTALVRPMGYRGLALASAIAFTVNIVLLIIVFRKRMGPFFDPALQVRLAKIVAASAAMGVAVYGVREGVTMVPLPHPFAERALHALTPILAGVALYTAAGYTLGMTEFQHFWAVFRRKRG